MDIQRLFVHRFDLMAKLLYAKFSHISYFKELYKNHILTLNGGAEDTSKQCCVDNFVKAFDLLIKKMRSDKTYDHDCPITIGNNDNIIKGAHRVALCFLLKIQPVFQFNKEADGLMRWNYDYFIHRHRYSFDGPSNSNPTLLPPSMDKSYTDRMALEFCLSFTNYKVILLFPAALGKDRECEEQLAKHGTIYYKKEVYLSEKGLINLTFELYRGEEWIGGMFPNNVQKGKQCFAKGSPLRVYIFVPSEGTNMISLKKQIRDIYCIGNHSIHIHDTFEEGLRIAKSTLNHNSIQFLMQGDSTKLSEKEKKLLLEYYHSMQQKAPEEREYFAIDTSFVLSVHGLREAKDLDYIFLKGSATDIVHCTKDIECHENNGSAAYFPKEIILFVPDNHFYFMGLKFASLEIVKQTKEKRNEKKDIEDVNLIEKHTTLFANIDDI